MRTAPFRAASDKQRALMTRLAGEATAAGLPVPSYDPADPGLSVGAASTAIDILLERLRLNAAAARPAATPGYYVADGEVLTVVKTRDGERTYAKRLVMHGGRARWVYEKGLGAMLAASVPLTAEEAARLGHLHGVCVICGAALTDPGSVERGIGPVCITKLSM